jgi:histidyl-tRNA synthetase
MLASSTKVMMVNFGGDEEAYALQVLQDLRKAGISAELYPEAAKFDKQMKYANKRSIPYVMILGEEERKQQLVSLKDFTTGKQEMLTAAAAVNVLKG